MSSTRRKIPVIATIIVIIGVTILANLGFWQLDRATEKEQLLSELDARKTQMPMTLQALDDKDDKAYYHLAISGELLQQYTLYLDNRIVSGRPGFEVIHPVKIGKRIVLVNRGWIPMPQSRATLPILPEQESQFATTGVVYVPTKALVLREDVLLADEDWPKLIQSLDMPKLASLFEQLDLTIEPWVLRQDPTEDSLFVQAWRYVNMPPERHISYAVTWFGLAIALVIIYIAALLFQKEKPVGRQPS